MSNGVNGRLKFKFSAKVEYVTEELDHNGNLFYMFNIKVVADPDDSHHEPMQWSVIKSEDDFLQTHKALRNKYGLLKSFQFRNPSAIGSNMFHLTNAVKPRREKKDEYLSLILELEPIPDEIVAFLCLDNASYYKESTQPLSPGPPAGNMARAVAVPTADTGTSISRKLTPTMARPVTSAVRATAVATPVMLTERERQSKKWWLNAGLLVSFLTVTGSAAVLSGLASTLGQATGISRSDSVGKLNCKSKHCSSQRFPKIFQMFVIAAMCALLYYSTAMLVYLAVTQYIHLQLVLVRARLEVVIIFLVVFAYAHRVIGYALGLYLRSKLDASNSGKFNFHFEWISLRVGLDCNMLVIHGLEWRNPPMFKNTPYLLRIDEISFVVDPVSVYNAIKSNAAIKIQEIRFNKVALYIEKLSETSVKSGSKAECSGEDAPSNGDQQEAVPLLSGSAKQKSVRLDEKGSAVEVTAVAATVTTTSTGAAEVTSTATAPLTSISTTNATVATAAPVTLKPGVLNLWAAMGATNPQQEASMLTNVSGQMTAAMEGTTNMVSVLGSAVAKYNPASMLLKGGASLGGAIGSTIGSTIGTGTSLIGSTIGSGVGFLRGTSVTKKISAADLDDELSGAKAGNSEGDTQDSDAAAAAAMQRAIEESLQESADSLAGDEEDEAEGQTESQDASPAPSSPAPLQALNRAESANASTSGSTGTAASASVSGAAAGATAHAAAKGTKKGFGLPYQLSIQALQLDHLELHTQDFLNASHAQDTKASVIKLKSLSMSHRELSKPPKGESTKKDGKNGTKSAGKRRPLYLDEVVWRLVNKLLAELLRNNSIAMMVLLSSAAVNNTTSVVSTAGSLAYGGAATTKKVLSSVGSTVMGTFTSTSAAKGGNAASTPAPTAAMLTGSNSTTTAAVSVPVASTAVPASTADTSPSAAGKTTKST